MSNFFKPIGNLIDSVRSDIKFHGAGKGQKLSESTPTAGSAASTAGPAAAAAPVPRRPDPAAAKAGEAALQRFDKASAPPAARNHARRGLSSGEPSAAATPTSPPSTPLAQMAVTEPAEPELLPWNDPSRFDELGITAQPPLVAAVGRLRSFWMEGTDAQARLAEACLATMLKYVENIQAHPEDAKYRRLRASNAIFQERVAPVPGALDALLAAGFERQELAPAEPAGAPAEPAGAPAEPFYLFSGDAAALDGLKALLQQKVELNRDVRVYSPSTTPQALPVLPDDYYWLTRDELIEEQRNRQKRNELERTLRTREMRERDQIKRGRLIQSKPKQHLVTCIRVRFPDGRLLQGRFAAREPVSAVYEFVRTSLDDTNCAFTLATTVQGKKLEATSQPLAQLELVPATLLHAAASTPGGPSPRLSAVLLALEESL